MTETAVREPSEGLRVSIPAAAVVGGCLFVSYLLYQPVVRNVFK